MIHGRVIAAIAFAAFCLSAHAGSEAVPGQFVVQFKNGFAARDAHWISRAHGVALVERPLVEDGEYAMRSLRADPAVAYVEPNYVYRAFDVRPNDPGLDQLWGLDNSGQNVTGDWGPLTGKRGMDIEAIRAWSLERGSPDVLVAVIDSGLNLDEPDLAGAIDLEHAFDFVDGDALPYDQLGHGTHVSGTLAARAGNGLGIAGVAPGVRLLPLRFLDANGNGTLANAVKAIDLAVAAGARVINNSWGGGKFSQALYDAIARARDADVLFVAASGNLGQDLDDEPVYPASYALDNVISVAAIDPSGELAAFSNFGRHSVDVAAPGVNILSLGLQGALVSQSGTSMACPHVSGVAALLRSQAPAQTYSQIKARLLAAARPLPSLRPFVRTGLVDAYHALTDSPAPGDPGDPFFWRLVPGDTAGAATAHPYAKGLIQEWTFHAPGARRTSVYFSEFHTENAYDVVRIFDGRGQLIGKMSGKLGAAFSPPVEGDTITIRFSSDESITEYGFEVGGLAVLE